MNVSQSVQKVDGTNIQASPVAVRPPAPRSNKTHHEERPRLRKDAGKLYYIIEV